MAEQVFGHLSKYLIFLILNSADYCDITGFYPIIFKKALTRMWSITVLQEIANKIYYTVFVINITLFSYFVIHLAFHTLLSYI